MPDDAAAIVDGGTGALLVDMVKHHEGFARVVRRAPVPAATPYLCPAGHWTIAYGHVCSADFGEIEEPAGALLLEKDLAIAARAVHGLISWPLAARQVAALTSWTFNLGAARLRASTLRQVINRGELDRAPDEMRKWVYGGGRILPGLVARRADEAALFLSA